MALRKAKRPVWESVPIAARHSHQNGADTQHELQNLMHGFTSRQIGGYLKTGRAVGRVHATRPTGQANPGNAGLALMQGAAFNSPIPVHQRQKEACLLYIAAQGWQRPGWRYGEALALQALPAGAAQQADHAATSLH